MQKSVQLLDVGRDWESGQASPLESDSLLSTGSLQHLKRRQTVTTVLMTSIAVAMLIALAMLFHLTFQLSSVAQQVKVAQQADAAALAMLPVLTDSDNNSSLYDNPESNVSSSTGTNLTQLERFPLLVSPLPRLPQVIKARWHEILPEPADR